MYIILKFPSLDTFKLPLNTDVILTSEDVHRVKEVKAKTQKFMKKQAKIDCDVDAHCSVLFLLWSKKKNMEWLGFRKNYVIFKVGHRKWLRPLMYKVGGWGEKR